MKLRKNPVPAGIKYLDEEETVITEIHAEIDGPENTPFEGGTFRLKLVLPKDFPDSAPKGYFLTKIFHPNVGKSGEICVNALKKDWSKETDIDHVFQVIRCLLIQPGPDSALNCEAGKLLLESYENYYKRAKMMTELHATPKPTEEATPCDSTACGDTASENSTATDVTSVASVAKLKVMASKAKQKNKNKKRNKRL